MDRIITTPTGPWLRDRVAACQRRLVVASPFVGLSLSELLKHKSRSVTCVLITRTSLRDFAAGSSDLNAVCAASRLGADVRSLPRLHAKVFVFDGVTALVTSANATPSGLYRNYECGLEVTDSVLANRIEEVALSGFGAPEAPSGWSLAQLESLKKPVDALKAFLKRAVLEEYPKTDVDQWDLTPEAWAEVGNELSGWTRLVLNSLNSIPSNDFDISQVYRVCLPISAVKFPKNRFQRQKIRQQLQRLRDLGYLEFLGEGHYRKGVG